MRRETRMSSSLEMEMWRSQSRMDCNRHGKPRTCLAQDGFENAWTGEGGWGFVPPEMFLSTKRNETKKQRQTT